MPDDSPSAVEAYLQALDHPRDDEIRRLRSALMVGIDGLDEHVKWNAPSFRFAEEDRATFRLRPGSRVQLVLHRGAKRRDPDAAFPIDDPEGLVEWRAGDRGVITFADAADTAAKQDAVVELVRRWVADTG